MFNVKTKKGSVLAYSLIVMFMLLSIALIMSKTSTISLQNSITTTKSVQAVQIAESGSQLAKSKIISLRSTATNTINDLKDPTLPGANCDSSGKITGASIAGGTYDVAFYKSSDTLITDCNTGLSDVKKIQVQGTKGDVTRAIEVSIPDPAALQIAASSSARHVLIVNKNGKNWAFGQNGGHEINGSSSSYINSPVEITSGITFNVIAAGYGKSFGIDTDGDVWAWGTQLFGEFGNGTDYSSRYDSPTKISNIRTTIGSKLKIIAAGGYTSLGLDESGQVWAWGYNGHGQLGKGDTNNSNIPVRVQKISGENLADIAAISVGGLYGNGSAIHCLALDKSGNVWAWGYNGHGQLGYGNTNDQNRAVRVKTGLSTYLSGITSISAGSYFSAASNSAGKVFSWGKCNGNPISSGCIGGCASGYRCSRYANEYLETTFNNISTVAAGKDYFLALKNGGIVLSTSNGPNVTGLSNIKSVSAGSDLSLALDGSGNVWKLSPGSSTAPSDLFP